MATSSGAHRITRGDVEAVLNAFGGGGRAVLLHSKTAEGAPADFFGSYGSIRPFAGSPWDGANFCAEEFGLQVAYYFQQGQIMSPADLSAGSHRLEVTIIDASGGQSFQDGITFFIAAPGTGVCV